MLTISSFRNSIWFPAAPSLYSAAESEPFLASSSHPLMAADNVVSQSPTCQSCFHPRSPSLPFIFNSSSIPPPPPLHLLCPSFPLTLHPPLFLSLIPRIPFSCTSYSYPCRAVPSVRPSLRSSSTEAFLFLCRDRWLRCCAH